MKKDYAIIFDLDGTLLDTASLIWATFRYVFKILKPEYQLSDEELRSFLGPSLHDSFSRYFNEEEVVHAIDIYQQYNCTHQEEFVTIFDGVKETLEILKDDYPLAIVSTKRRIPVFIGLDLFDLSHYFEEVLTLEDVSCVKPDPEGILKVMDKLNVKKAIYVGDNASDILAGKNAHVETAGVYYSNNLEALLDSQPDLMMHTVRELIPYLKEIELKC